MGFILLGLVGLSIVLAAVYWMSGSGGAPEGDGSLIAAPKGDYKVLPPGSAGTEGRRHRRCELRRQPG